ncbi:hypothetical protein ANO14919_049070 [Xylariales sp. No.14919]|nr:hypothetical protein ANO14919_049070 [Xylariales sp. No.14919]
MTEWRRRRAAERPRKWESASSASPMVVPNSRHGPGEADEASGEYVIIIIIIIIIFHNRLPLSNL